METNFFRTKKRILRQGVQYGQYAFLSIRLLIFWNVSNERITLITKDPAQLHIDTRYNQTFCLRNHKVIYWGL